MVIDKYIKSSIYIHTHIKMTKKERKRTKQRITHLFIHSTHADVTLHAGDKIVNKRGKVPALT